MYHVLGDIRFIEVIIPLNVLIYWTGDGGSTGKLSILPEIVKVIWSPKVKLDKAIWILVPFKSVSLIYNEDTYR